MNLTQYAAHRKALGLRGGSHVAVHYAIRDGRLTPPAVRREGNSWIIDPALADRQWSANTDHERGHNTDKDRAVSAIEQTAPTVPKSPTPSSRSRSTEPARPPKAPASPPSDEGLWEGIPSLNVSKTRKALIDAQLAQLDLMERRGRLLRVEEVEREAFALARRVREAVMNIPDRIAAELAALPDASAIHALLTRELRAALAEVSDG